MKATGIVRRIDWAGRVTIPMETRRTLGISESDPLEMYVDGETIILKKYQPGCMECGAVEEELFGEKVRLCRKCAIRVSMTEHKE